MDITNVNKVRNGLEASGHVVQDGSYRFFFLEDCMKFNLSSCFALNADSPYGLTLLPPAPTEQTYRGCSLDLQPYSKKCGNGCNPNNDPELDSGVCFDNLPMQWRLDSNEAVILMGDAPPNSKYWSFTSYLMSQYYESSPRVRKPDLGPIQGAAVKCAEGPNRCQKFASLGTPFNQNHLKDLSNGTGFAEPFALILTANKDLYQEISKLIPNSIPSYLYPYPADTLNMGTDNDYRDMMTMLLRVAYPADSDEARRYYEKPPISVLRVSGGNKQSDLFAREDCSFPSRVLGEKEHTESITAEQLQDFTEELREKVMEKYSHLRAYEFDFKKPFFVTGFDCIDEGTECNGDAYDTLYPISANIYTAMMCRSFQVRKVGYSVAAILFLFGAIVIRYQERRTSGSSEMQESLLRGKSIFMKSASGMRRKILIIFWGALVVLISCGTYWFWHNTCASGHAATIDGSKNDVYFVYGVNHQATEHTSYSSITLYRYATLTGLVSKSSENDYHGSATPFLGPDHPANKYVFVYAFARDCAAQGLDEFCYDVPFEGNGVPESEYLLFIERMYVNPITGVGPMFNETISTRGIHLW